MNTGKNNISRITRRSILELLNTHFYKSFHGRLDELEFWGKLFDLEKLPSSDARFDTLSRDIQQHRINNNDWEDNWYIEKFDLIECEDSIFLKFLSLFFHPEVRDYDWNTVRIIKKVNTNLSYDGITLYEKEHISGRAVLGAKKITPQKPESQYTQVEATNDLINIKIHKKIYEHIIIYMKNEDYFHAVEESYKVVRKKLREITSKEKATDIFNMNAQNKKYHIDIFGKNAEPNTPEEDFFRGVGFLNLAIQFLRNEKSHSPATTLDKNLALHYISLASLSYDLITQDKADKR